MSLTFATPIVDRQTDTNVRDRHSSLKQRHTAEETAKMVSTMETELNRGMEATNNQLALVNAKMGALQHTRESEGETEADRASAITQAATEQTSLEVSAKLLQELLSKTKTAAAQAMRDHGGTRTITFGNQGKGIQVTDNSGNIQGTFA